MRSFLPKTRTESHGERKTTSPTLLRPTNCFSGSRRPTPTHPTRPPSGTSSRTKQNFASNPDSPTFDEPEPGRKHGHDEVCVCARMSVFGFSMRLGITSSFYQRSCLPALGPDTHALMPARPWSRQGRRQQPSVFVREGGDAL